MQDREKCIFHDRFRHFFVTNYGAEASKRRHEETGDDIHLNEDGLYWPLYGNIVWWRIYDAHFSNTKTDAELLDTFVKDFEDFANPLTRLATEVQ